MQLRTIEIFVAIVEEDGMTSAARRFGLTQSAVSQALSGLEQALGHQLIDRTVRPPKPTLMGSLFFKKAVQLLELARELEQVTEKELNQTLPQVNIGMVESFAATAGPHLVKELDNLAAAWSVSSSAHDTGVRALLERRVDFLITSDASADRDDVNALPLFEEQYCIVASKADGKHRNKPIRVLAREQDFIRYGATSFIGPQVEAYLREHAIPATNRYRLDTTDAVLAMVKARMGWTITTPLCLLKMQPSVSELSIRPLSPPMSRRLYLLSRKIEGLELAQRIAVAARSILSEYCGPQIAKFAPWTKA